MNKAIPFALLLLTLTLVACKKDDPTPVETSNALPTTNAYFPLAVGNYWVYDFQSYTPNGEPTGNPSVDSLKVVGDSLIMGELYFQLETNRPVQRTLLLRDDNGVVVSKFGSVMLPNEPDDEIYNAHFGQIGGDTTHFYFDEFPRTEMVETNFGLVSCITQESTHEMFPSFGGATIVDTTYYASFGPVERSYAFGS
ncbi:MAG: hypothetical protein ACPGED_09950, partial [Flavobacteriales bacterium]